MKILNKIAKIIEKLSDFAGFLAGILTLATFLLVLIEVTLRSVFNISTLIADEYTTYFFIGLTYLGLSYILKRDGHIRVKVLMTRLSNKGQMVLDLICSFVSVMFISYFIVFSFKFFLESYHSNITAQTPAETPLFIPQSMISIGLIFLLLQFFARIIRNFDSLSSKVQETPTK